MQNITKSKSIYTLSRPVWLDTSGMNKGINHDRQHLGIILDAGKTIKIRQTNATFSKNLTMHLLNDDNKTEAQFSVGNSWIEAHVNAVSVPFIDTPYVNGMPWWSLSIPIRRKICPSTVKVRTRKHFSVVGILKTQNLALLNLNTLTFSYQKQAKEN